ncbi:MAG: hypothetical protein AAFX78_18825 [Cyanobacteria bacterium J06638_20]
MRGPAYLIVAEQVAGNAANKLLISVYQCFNLGDVVQIGSCGEESMDQARVLIHFNWVRCLLTGGTPLSGAVPGFTG